MTARSRGWPLSVVLVDMVGVGGFLNCGTWNLSTRSVAVKLRVVTRRMSFRFVVAVRMKLQRGRIHLIFFSIGLNDSIVDGSFGFEVFVTLRFDYLF